MFGLMRISEHRRILKEERKMHEYLNLEAWRMVVRMTAEIRGAQKGLYRLQRKMKRLGY